MLLYGQMCADESDILRLITYFSGGSLQCVCVNKQHVQVLLLPTQLPFYANAIFTTHNTLHTALHHSPLSTLTLPTFSLVDLLSPRRQTRTPQERQHS